MAVNGLPRFNIQRYLISGLLTVIPIWATWIVLEFVFRGLSRIGSPVVRAVAGGIRIASWLALPRTMEVKRQLQICTSSIR